MNIFDEESLKLFSEIVKKKKQKKYESYREFAFSEISADKISYDLYRKKRYKPAPNNCYDEDEQLLTSALFI